MVNSVRVMYNKGMRMEIIGILFVYVFYRALTSESRSLARQRKVAERYEKESMELWDDE